MLRSAAVWLLLGLAVPAFWSPAVAGQAADPPQKRVLVLYALSQEMPAYSILERIYPRALAEGLPGGLDYYSELIDVSRFEDPDYETAVIDFFLRKYRDREFDLVIANGPTEMAFAAKILPRLSPDAALVFNGGDVRRTANSTGLSYSFAMKESLDLALRLQPETSRIFVVGGVSDFDRYYADAFRRQVQTPPQGVTLTYLMGVPLPELTTTLSSLPEHSIIFYVGTTQDRNGHRLNNTDVLEKLAAAANAPMYGWIGTGLGRGIVGGRLLSVETIAERTAALAVRVLHGERPETIPIATIDASSDQLDWRQLRRWAIADAGIPAGTALLFREPSLFEAYRGYITGLVGLVALQSGLIAGLLIQARRRRRAEDSLRESEERFRLMADTAPVMIRRSGADHRADFFNRPWLEFRGRTLAQEIGEGWTEGLHPDDRERCVKAYADAFARREPFGLEYRLRRADGEYRWILDTGVLRETPHGAFLGYIGSSIDITARKRAEETSRDNEAALRRSHEQIQDLAGRLLTAQEAERARIARELHDGVSQELAGFSIAISGLKRRPEIQNSAELQEALAALQRRTIGLTEDIRHMSHDLHPGVLQHAGLVDALRSHCSEFAKQHAIAVAVTAESDPDVVELAPALCLYRVTQEALRNVAKHAHARNVEVVVSRSGDDVHLSIADDGKGFDLAKVRQSGGGLGLRSIEERVRLARGHVSIETTPHQGTTLSVRLAIERQPVAQAAGV